MTEAAELVRLWAWFALGLALGLGLGGLAVVAASWMWLRTLDEIEARRGAVE